MFGGTDPFSSSFLSSLNPVTYTKCYFNTERMSEMAYSHSSKADSLFIVAIIMEVYISFIL